MMQQRAWESGGRVRWPVLVAQLQDIRRTAERLLGAIISAGLAHHGFAFIDIISPCVTFRDHQRKGEVMTPGTMRCRS